MRRIQLVMAGMLLVFALRSAVEGNAGMAMLNAVASAINLWSGWRVNKTTEGE